MSETNNITVRKKRSQAQEIWMRFKKNKLAVCGLIILIILLLVTIFAGVIVNYQQDVIRQDIANKLQGPSARHWFGTDTYGRDIFARIIYGTRISLTFSISATLISVFLGGIIGCISGFYGGKVDNIIMRLTDIFLAIPFILLAIAIVAALGPGLLNLMVAMVIASIPSYARLFRSAVLSIRNQEFIEAARAIGASDFHIILRHIVPNIIGPILVQATLGISGQILAVAALSYLGLGIQPPTPEWGTMLSDGKQYMRYHEYLILVPGLAIVLTVLAVNSIGDGLNDALDPKLRNR